MHENREVLPGAELIGLSSGGMVHVDGRMGASPVLCLHGVGGAAWSWAPQQAQWRERRRLYLWEARGHGSAPPVLDAGFADFYVDATEALEYAVADAGAPVALIGHSLGGLLALALAANCRRCVAALVLIDPAYLTGVRYRRISPRVRTALNRTLLPLAQRFVRGGPLSRGISRVAFASSFRDRLKMEAAWPQQRRQRPIEHPQLVTEAFHGPHGFDLRDFAAEVDVPTLLLDAAPNTRRARFPSLVDTLRERLRERFEHDAIHGGHYLQLDRPEAVTARIDLFLARHLAEA